MTETMRWYNPVRRVYEEAPAPMSDAQAIELLSGHPDSDEFIEEYRRWRATHSDVVRALILTGGAFYIEHQRDQSPN
jgi:surfactin synthase thioesterase subunit